MVVIDTGVGIEFAKRANEKMRAITQKPVVAIVYTHHHADHTGGLVALVAQTGARVLGPALEKIPEVTVAHVATGRFALFAKIRCRDARHAKDIIFQISDIESVQNTETMIALEECVNSSKGLLRSIIQA